MISKKLITQYITHCTYKKNYVRGTLENYRISLESIYYFICKATLEDPKFTEDVTVDEKMIAKYIQYCRDKKIGEYTINGRISSLNGYMKYIEKRYGVPAIPVKGVAPKKKTEYTYLKKKEREILIKGLGKPQCFRNKAIILLILNTGLKVKQVYKLNYSQDIFEKIEVDKRVIETPHVVKCALMEYINKERGTDKGALFLSRKDTRLTPRSIERMIQKASECSGLLKTITPEDLRQTYIIDLANKKMDEAIIRKHLGHREPLTINKVKYI